MNTCQLLPKQLESKDVRERQVAKIMQDQSMESEIETVTCCFEFRLNGQLPKLNR